MTIAGTSVVWLPVSNLERAIEFYSEALGLEQKQREELWAEFDANGLRIGLNARDEKRPGHGWAVIACQTQNGLDPAVSELRERGVQFVDEISEHPWGRVAAFNDPEGNALQLYEPRWGGLRRTPANAPALTAVA